jgi:hypothetical protein
MWGLGTNSALVWPKEVCQQRLPVQCKSSASTRLVGSVHKSLKKFVHACGDEEQIPPWFGQKKPFSSACLYSAKVVQLQDW